MRLRTILCALLGALAAAGPANAADADGKGPGPAALVDPWPVWDVLYLDDQLGPIVGNALVDWKEKKATLGFRYLDKTIRLTGQVLQAPTAEVPRFRVSFPERGLEPAEAAAPDLAKAPALTGAGEARISIGEDSKYADVATFAFADPPAADTGGITVDLAVDGEGDMRGRWYYTADPMTQRNATRGGRTGIFSMAPDGSFLGQQAGSELWTRALPRIDYVLEIEDQLDIPHFLPDTPAVFRERAPTPPPKAPQPLTKRKPGLVPLDDRPAFDPAAFDERSLGGFLPAAESKPKKTALPLFVERDGKIVTTRSVLDPDPEPNRLADRRTLLIVGSDLPLLPVGDSDFGATPGLVRFGGELVPIFLGVGSGQSQTPAAIETIAGGEEYTYVGRLGDNFSIDDREKIESGWTRILDSIKDPGVKADVATRQSALIKVKLKQGFIPGMKRFTWGGVDVDWRLQSRDAFATATFVRPVAEPGGVPKWEPTPVAYLPERIAVEVRLSAPIPFDSFTVKVKPFEVGVGPMPATTAAEVGGQAGVWKAIGPEAEYIAERVGPLLYRTRQITVDRRPISPFGDGEDIGFDMRPGTVLMAHVNPTHGLLSAPARTQVRAASSPGAAQPLWTEYVVRALKAKRVEEIMEARRLVAMASAGGAPIPVDDTPPDPDISDLVTTDLRALASAPDTRISNTLVLYLERRHVDIYFGHHAAMLLLRDGLVGMLRRADAALEAATANDDSVRGYAALARQTLRRNPNAVIGRLEAGKPYDFRSPTVTLADALNPQFSEYRHTPDRDLAMIGWVRHAIGEYRKSIQKSVATLQAISDNDVEQLLRLTATPEFKPVIDEVVTRLMIYDERAREWVPDRPARQFLAALPNMLEQLKFNEQASSIERRIAVDAVLTIVTFNSVGTFANLLVAAEGSILDVLVAGGVAAGDLVTVANGPTEGDAIKAVAGRVLTKLPTWAGESGGSFLVSAVGQGVMWAADSFSSLYSKIKTDDQIAFAFGASPVLGDKLFNEAVVNESSWIVTLAALGISTASAVNDIVGNIRKASAAVRIARGARISERQFSSWSVSQLSDGERDDFLAFLAHAKSLQKSGQRLTKVQFRAVDIFDGLAAAATSDPDGLKKGLSLSKSFLKRQQELGKLREAAIANKAPKEVIASLQARSEAMQEMWNAIAADPRIAKVLSQEALDGIGGQAFASAILGKPDEVKALALAAAHDFDWSNSIKKAYNRGEIDPLEMNNYVSYRKQVMKQQLQAAGDKVAAELEQETGKRPVVRFQAAASENRIAAEIEKEAGKPPVIEFKAVGSENLNSDLDFTVSGEGAERVLKSFYEDFRKLPQFRQLESGTVFDSYLYTQAVYELYGRNRLTGQATGVAIADLDAARQLMFVQMAARKYSTSEQAWKELTQGILAATPDANTRAMFSDVFDEAELAYRAGRRAIAGKLGVGVDALHDLEGSDKFIKATNSAYVDVAMDIDRWRNELKRVQQLKIGEVSKLAEPPAELLERYPGVFNELKRIRVLQAAGREAEFRALADEWESKLAYLLRRKQGEALFYASEAYQGEATILHVVRDLQEFKRAKEITLDKLKGGKMSAVLDRNDGRGAINSAFENLANMQKELGHAKTLQDAAAKGAKYFVRVADGAHEAGIDVVQIMGEEVIVLTIGVDARRANIDKVAEFLNPDAKLRPGDNKLKPFVDALTGAQLRLGAQMVKHDDVTSLARRLAPLFGDNLFPSAAESLQKTGALGEAAR